MSIKNIKHYLIIFTIIIIFISGNNSFALSKDLNLFTPSCILIDEESGKILYNKNANKKMYPASTTKIMTAILTLDNCKLSDTVKISHNAVFSIPYGYSTAYLKEGEILTIEQLLNVLLIPSANDAAVALAEHIGGSVENFSNMMNEKAIELGCKNTHFVNPNGIHNENHYSTAYDLALIGQYANKFDIYKSIIKRASYKLSPNNIYTEDNRIFNNTNDLIKPNYKNSYYQHCTGGKTGYTDAAKNCIVANATKNNLSLICVVLHDSKTETGISQRALDCKTLFEFGFNNYSYKKIASKSSIAKTIQINNGTKETQELDLLYSSDLVALLPNDIDILSIQPTIKLTDNILAPIFEGTNLGLISYTIDNTDYSCNLIASHTVYKKDITKTILEIILLIFLLFIFAKIIHYTNHSKIHKLSKTNKQNSKSKNKPSNKNYINNFYPTYKKDRK